MNEKTEKVSAESYEALEQRLLKSEGQIQALAHYLLCLTAELQERHGLNAEQLENALTGKCKKGVLLEPHAAHMLSSLVDVLRDASDSRLREKVWKTYGAEW